DPVASLIHSAGSTLHFQEYWVARDADPPVDDVEFRGTESARPTERVLEALRSEPVVVGPSNPVTSIGPMLALDGVREALAETTVVAVSPFVEDRVFSGPAADLMEAMGMEPSTAGVAAAYPFADAFVLDDADGTRLERPVVKTDTAIETRDDSERVARAAARGLEAA
ncbi:MAG: 2-phospho-L-lactate transferase CofD family protein, partial [Halodesulfurarchaeum sp.]